MADRIKDPDGGDAGVLCKR